MSEIDDAARYDDWFRANESIFESEARALEVQLPEGWERAVEIGCGTGLFAERLGVSLGVEPSDAMASRARERGLRVESGTAEDVPLADGSVDLAVLSGVVGYVDDLGATAAEAARVVEPGGDVVVGFLHADRGFAALYDRAVERGSYPDDAPADPYPLGMAAAATWRTADEVIDRLSAAGVEPVETVQTLTRPPTEAVDVVKSPTSGHDRGSWVVVHGRRSESGAQADGPASDGTGT
jgi:SAM-dependent methyltransferase